MSKRDDFCRAAFDHLGEVVCWSHLDCSELVAIAGIAVGLPDRRKTHTAQRYREENPEPTTAPKPGDLAFWGNSHAVHVAIVLKGGNIISADGATAAITSLEEARKRPYARVRIHPSIGWYHSAPFIGFRVHRELDQPPSPRGAA